MTRLSNFALCVSLVVMATTCVARGRLHDVACSEPPNLQSLLDSQGNPASLIHETFFQIPQLRDSLLQGEPLPVEQQPKRSIFSGVPRDCAQRYWNVTDRDLCPSYYVINMDTTRVPSMLLESRCHCQSADSGLIRESAPRCLVAPGETVKDSRDSRMKCEPVHYHTWVLRRGECLNGVYQYHRVLEPVQVGCQCRMHSLNIV